MKFLSQYTTRHVANIECLIVGLIASGNDHPIHRVRIRIARGRSAHRVAHVGKANVRGSSAAGHTEIALVSVGNHR